MNHAIAATALLMSSIIRSAVEGAELLGRYGDWGLYFDIRDAGHMTCSLGHGQSENDATGKLVTIQNLNFVIDNDRAKFLRLVDTRWDFEAGETYKLGFAAYNISLWENLDFVALKDGSSLYAKITYDEFDAYSDFIENLDSLTSLHAYGMTEPSIDVKFTFSIQSFGKLLPGLEQLRKCGKLLGDATDMSKAMR